MTAIQGRRSGRRAGLLAGEIRSGRLAGFRGRWFWTGSGSWLLYFLSPLATGWLTAGAFTELQSDGATLRFWGLLAGMASSATAAALLLAVGHRRYMIGFASAEALARCNVMDAQLSSGGAGAAARTVSVGDAVARLRDDPLDLLYLVDNWIDLVGAGLYAIGAVVVLATIDPWAALAGVGPMVLVVAGNRLIGTLARRYRLEARTAASGVSDFLTAAVSASLTVKVAGAQGPILRRLDQLNRRRAGAAVMDQTWNEVLWSVNNATADLFLGLALVVAARRGVGLGEIALFAAYMATLLTLPARVSGTIVGRRRYEVSAKRLDGLLPSAPPGGPDPLTAHRDLPILGGPPARRPAVGARVPLERLEVEGLTVAARGLAGVSFVVERGELVVVAGPVGSGKSSLLRAVVGLVPLDAGTIRWNGGAVGDRAAFFVPPQSAFVPQVPRLFAASLSDNVRLGHDLDSPSVASALALAAFERDVAEFPDGLATKIGARGVRLSGGQAQRAAAARALVHRPELLVLDDLTSALDVETEVALWEALAVAGLTVLAASNRPAALARADRIIRLG